MSSPILWRCRIAIIVVAEAFVDKRVLTAADQGLRLAIFRCDDGSAVFECYAGSVLQNERVGGSLAQRVDAVLHRRDFVRMCGGYVLLLVGIFGDVVEVDARGNQGAPDQFPVTLADCAAERLYIID